MLESASASAPQVVFGGLFRSHAIVPANTKATPAETIPIGLIVLWTPRDFIGKSLINRTRLLGISTRSSWRPARFAKYSYTRNPSLPPTNRVLAKQIEHSFTPSLYLLLTSPSRASYRCALVWEA